MGFIKKIKNCWLVGGTDNNDVYPVTSTKAVFDENNVSQDYLNKHITGDRIEANTITGDKLEDKALTEEKVSDALMDKINSAAHGVTEEFETEVREALEKVVNTVSVNNGTPLEPDTNKNINITVPENLAELNTDEDHRTVTDEEKSTWSGKQDALTFDNVPTANSNNPVKSGGVYQAIQDIDVTDQISGKADKSEMSVVAGTGADADKTTITLKSGTSATVLTQHQDVSEFLREGEVFGTGDDSTASFNPYSDTVWNKAQTLSESQKQQIRDNIGVSVADNEDIQSVNGTLKFADRAYTATTSSVQGNMGYKILRKGNTFASQVTTANTIYEIRYDYDLNAQTVTLPAGCVLKFNGGSLENGIIVGTDTIVADNFSFLNCSVGGTFVTEKAYINATNMAKALEVFKTKNFIISENVALADGFDTSTLVSCEVEGNGHVINVPSLSVQNGNNDFCVKNATFNLSDTRIISVDAFAFGIVGTGNGNIKLENVTFNGLSGTVYLRNQNVIDVSDCSFAGDSELATGSRLGGILSLNNKIVKVYNNQFANLSSACHILDGTTGDEISFVNENKIANCDGGIVSNGGIAKNYNIIGNVLTNVGTGGADKAAINIHGMDGTIVVKNNAIYETAGSIFDLDGSLSGAPNPNTDPHLVVRNNKVRNTPSQGISLWMIKDVLFENNDIAGLTYINQRNNALCVIRNNKLNVTTKLTDSQYTIAGEYTLSITDNRCEGTIVNNLLVDTALSTDNTTLNITILDNQKPSDGNVYFYTTRNASSARVVNKNVDLYYYGKIDLQTLPFNINKSLMQFNAYTKLSFDLSEAKGESAYSFFAEVGIYKSNSSYIFAITKSHNSTPRLQTLYGNAAFTNPRIFYEYNADTLLLDVYILVGARFAGELRTILSNSPQNKFFNVQITGASTSVAVAETKTRLYSATYIETRTYSELQPCYDGAISFNTDNGFIVKYGYYPINYLGIRAGKLIGATTDRPANNTLTAGYQFYDTTLGRPIWWNGSAWIDATGILSDTPTTGIFANKPTVSNNAIPIGFRYFCTDKQTTEGATNGIEIIHKGNDVWVDALGRVVS